MRHRYFTEGWLSREGFNSTGLQKHRSWPTAVSWLARNGYQENVLFRRQHHVCFSRPKRLMGLNLDCFPTLKWVSQFLLLSAPRLDIFLFFYPLPQHLWESERARTRDAETWRQRAASHRRLPSSQRLQEEAITSLTGLVGQSARVPISGHLTINIQVLKRKHFP